MANRVLFLQKPDEGKSEIKQWLVEAKCEYDPWWIEHGKPKAQEVKILVTKEHHVDAGLLDAYPNLEMVSLGFTGYDEVDLKHAKSRDIHVYFVPGYATASVAELNVGLALSVLRKIPMGNDTIRQGHWDRKVYPGVELQGKTVGILGTGTIGIETARRFLAFGCEVLGWTRTRRQAFEEIGAGYVSKGELFARADLLVLCLALNEDTHHFVGGSELKRMKPGAVLINTARAELVDGNALLTALNQERVFAGLDVFEKEPKAGEDGFLDFNAELLKIDRVVLTPHIGFKTRQALRRLTQQTIANIGRFLKGDSTNRLA